MFDIGLEIDSKDIESLYEWYREETLIVNRRYQRKLVWSLEEKRSLISSVLNAYPIPLLLFVNVAKGREILDGMQRLEALMSFIDQRYSYNGKYFDLEATALTKDLRDNGSLEQKQPMLTREESKSIARYKFAISSYSSSGEHIEEVFKRINSNGRTLSKQELRSAGNVTNFSELVRRISIELRGDTSHSDSVLLNNMHKISIGSEGLDYGVSIENHFYVTSSIMTRKNFRASIDEELIAHILSYVCLHEKPMAGSDSLDRFYSFSEGSENSSQRIEIENFIQSHDQDELVENFRKVFETIRNLFESANVNFNKHILGYDNTSHECPRYFQVVFLAFYELIVNQNQTVSEPVKLLEKLKNIGAGDGSIIKFTSGRRWAAGKREDSVMDVVYLISRFFKQSTEHKQNLESVMLIDKLLTNSGTEQPNYDFKQGFLPLANGQKFSDDLLFTVMSTMVGINNISKGSSGFVLVGVADNENDAMRFKQIRGQDALKRSGDFHIVGVDAEAKEAYGSLDAYLSAIKDKIKKKFDLTASLKQQILKDLRLVKYAPDRHILVFTVKGVDEVAHIDGNYYLRQGTSTELVPNQEFGALFANFNRQ